MKIELRKNERSGTGDERKQTGKAGTGKQEAMQKKRDIAFLRKAKAYMASRTE